jgi:predicted dehydrogenase
VVDRRGAGQRVERRARILAAMSDKQPIRVGVIGTGFGALVQIPGFTRTPGFEVAAVASGRAARAQQAAEKFGIPKHYGDYRQMLANEDLDLVSITTPGYLHHEMVLATAEAKRNILCEKPFALNLGQAREMVDAAEQAGVFNAIDHEFRCLPARIKMKELADQGYLGEVRSVVVVNNSPVLVDPNKRTWDWWSDKSKYGGVLQAFTSHLYDLVLWMFGDVTRVCAQLDTFTKQRPTPEGEWRDVTSDDQNVTLMRFASGAQGTIHVSGVYRSPRSYVEAHGSQGSLVIDGEKLFGAQGNDKLQPIESPPPVQLGPGDDYRIAPFVTYLNQLLPALRGENAPEIATFRQGLRVQAIMDAVHRSSDEGQVVDVERV